jgi:hypothetical protein
MTVDFGGDRLTIAGTAIWVYVAKRILFATVFVSK